jgi:hypothetical protein
LVLADRPGNYRLDSLTNVVFHCAKALMRSHLWGPERHVERATFPTLGEIVSEHTGIAGPSETHEEMLARYGPTL